MVVDEDRMTALGEEEEVRLRKGSTWPRERKRKSEMKGKEEEEEERLAN